jgi:hypothetical protein
MERFYKIKKLLQTVNIYVVAVMDLYTSLANCVEEFRSNFTKSGTEAKMMSTKVYEADKKKEENQKTAS